MNKFRITIKLFVVATFLLAFASIAQAQATRTWVSGVGDDVNPCSRTAPCKTYAGAISKTAKDGEISTLDPGGFGAVTITKSITINGGNGGQGYGSILSALSPQGVLINITDPADVRQAVKLDWLNINGASTGTSGIRMIAGKSLHVENTLIDGMVSHGINIDTGTLNPVLVSVNQTSIRNCVATGIRTNTGVGGQVRLAVNDVHISKVGTGVDMVNGTRGTIIDSVITLSTTGVQVAEPSSGSVANVIATTINNNTGTGINVVGGSRARIARTNIIDNGTSLNPAAQVDSGGNNSIGGNTTNTAPAGGQPFPQN